MATTWLDDLLGKTILENGSPLPDRKLLNFIGSLTIADNQSTLSTDITFSGASFVSGPVTGSVDSASGEDVNPLRPSVLTDGDYTAYPFMHIAAAIAALPPVLNGNIARMNLTAGSYAGFNLSGFSGGALELCGSWATPTISSGVTSGTAGASSGGTTLNKPAAAASWPNDGSLVGLKVVVTGGSGFTGSDAMAETVRTIVAHSASSLSLQDSISAMDATTQFSIVREGTIINTAAANSVDGATCVIGAYADFSKLSMRRIKIDNSGAVASFALATVGVLAVDLGGMNIVGNWLGHEVLTADLSAVTIAGSVQLYNCGRTTDVNHSMSSGDFNAGAFAQITAHVGGGQSNATLCGSEVTIVGACASASDSVRLGAISDWPGVSFGARGEVRNETSNVLALYPNIGASFILAGVNQGANQPFLVNPWQEVYWLLDKDGNWRVS